MLWISETVRDKTPLQMKFPFIFRTLKIIRETVWNRFDIKLGVTTAWCVMQRLGSHLPEAQTPCIPTGFRSCQGLE